MSRVGIGASGGVWPAAGRHALLAPILKKITPAVVEIEIKGRLPPEPDAKKGVIREIQGTGSGVAYDESHGYIVTNSHVIEHADEITVTLMDGRVFKGKRVGGRAGARYQIGAFDLQDPRTIEDVANVPSQLPTTLFSDCRLASAQPA
jgi:S1-C subfamily serine protease